MKKTLTVLATLLALPLPAGATPINWITAKTLWPLCILAISWITAITIAYQCLTVPIFLASLNAIGPIGGLAFAAHGIVYDCQQG